MSKVDHHQYEDPPNSQINTIGCLRVDRMTVFCQSRPRIDSVDFWWRSYQGNLLIMSIFMFDLGTKLIFDATATPRANGQVESLNRTLLNAIWNSHEDERRMDENIGIWY